METISQLPPGGTETLLAICVFLRWFHVAAPLQLLIYKNSEVLVDYSPRFWLFHKYLQKQAHQWAQWTNAPKKSVVASKELCANCERGAECFTSSHVGSFLTLCCTHTRWRVGASFPDLTGYQNIVQHPGDTFLNSCVFVRWCFLFPTGYWKLEKTQGRKPTHCS